MSINPLETKQTEEITLSSLTGEAAVAGETPTRDCDGQHLRDQMDWWVVRRCQFFVCVCARVCGGETQRVSVNDRVEKEESVKKLKSLVMWVDGQLWQLKCSLVCRLWVVVSWWVDGGGVSVGCLDELPWIFVDHHRHQIKSSKHPNICRMTDMPVRCFLCKSYSAKY